MLRELTREKQLIEKTVQKICEGIEAGIWKFNLHFSNNIDSGDLEEFEAVEGKAFYQDYMVTFGFEERCSLRDRESSKSYKWHFISNLKKTNREEAFTFERQLSDMAIQYVRCSPEEKELLDLIKDSLELLEEAQNSFDLHDIDEA